MRTLTLIIGLITVGANCGGGGRSKGCPSLESQMAACECGILQDAVGTDANGCRVVACCTGCLPQPTTDPFSGNFYCRNTLPACSHVGDFAACDIGNNGCGGGSPNLGASCCTCQPNGQWLCSSLCPAVTNMGPLDCCGPLPQCPDTYEIQFQCSTADGGTANCYCQQPGQPVCDSVATCDSDLGATDGGAHD